MGMPRQTEAGFQRAVIQYARLMGWRVAHFRPARTANGWRTPVAADGVGWPDLVMTRGSRLVACELKSARGVVSAEQSAWLSALGEAGAETYEWRESDWAEIEEVLRR